MKAPTVKKLMKVSPSPRGKGQVLTIAITAYENGKLSVNNSFADSWIDVARNTCSLISGFYYKLEREKRKKAGNRQ